jgi:hypothetical protein
MIVTGRIDAALGLLRAGLTTRALDVPLSSTRRSPLSPSGFPPWSVLFRLLPGHTVRHFSMQSRGSVTNLCICGSRNWWSHKRDCELLLLVGRVAGAEPRSQAADTIEAIASCHTGVVELP